MKAEELKEKLKRIKDNDCILEGSDSYYEMSREMMNHIGDVDPVLRDELIYEIFCVWVYERQVLNPEELKELLESALDSNHLFYRIEEQNKDDVFTRTFSALLITLILAVNNKNCFLSDEKFDVTKNKLIDYMNGEKDVRGYVEGPGWAHSAAHTADGLDELAVNERTDKEDLIKILEAIQRKVLVGYYVYVDEESERMLNAVENAFNRKLLSEDVIINWFNQFISLRESCAFDTYIEKFHQKVNLKGFLRSAYFRFLSEEGYENIVERIRNILAELK